MFDYARSKNLIPLSAIHRKEDADFLLEYNLSAFKIASIDLHYHHLLGQLAAGLAKKDIFDDEEEELDITEIPTNTRTPSREGSMAGFSMSAQ